jgi:hypothetical protein
LRSTRLQGLIEVDPARLLVANARRSECLYTPFGQDHDSVFFSFLSIKPAKLPASMLEASLRERLRRPLVFFVVLTCWEKCFSSSHYSTYLFFLFWIIIPAIFPATMLGYYSMIASLRPSEFFIVVSIYWKSTSYRSSLDLSSLGKTANKLDAKLIYFFFLDRYARYLTCR